MLKLRDLIECIVIQVVCVSMGWWLEWDSSQHSEALFGVALLYIVATNRRVNQP